MSAKRAVRRAARRTHSIMSARSQAATTVWAPVGRSAAAAAAEIELERLKSECVEAGAIPRRHEAGDIRTHNEVAEFPSSLGDISPTEGTWDISRIASLAPARARVLAALPTLRIQAMKAGKPGWLAMPTRAEERAAKRAAGAAEASKRPLVVCKQELAPSRDAVLLSTDLMPLVLSRLGEMAF